MAALNKRPINLLVQNDLEHSTAGKILSWLLSTGRAIVIITELIVIVAFISRFWLDKTLTDLSEENASKRTQIEASLPFELEFKSVQKRLGLIKQIEDKKAQADERITTIAQLLPPDIILTNIAVTGTDVTLQGESLSEDSIANLINSLDESKQFTKTSLATISLENRVQQLITFKLTSTIVKKETK